MEEKDEEWTDDELNLMDRDELFERWLTWQGIIGYGRMVRRAAEKIYEVELRSENRTTK
jgi:hypothetical protein